MGVDMKRKSEGRQSFGGGGNRPQGQGFQGRKSFSPGNRPGGPPGKFGNKGPGAGGPPRKSFGNGGPNRGPPGKQFGGRPQNGSPGGNRGPFNRGPGGPQNGKNFGPKKPFENKNSSPAPPVEKKNQEAKSPEKKPQNTPNKQQNEQKKGGAGAKFNKKPQGVKAEQNGNAKDNALKKLDPKSKTISKGKQEKNKEAKKSKNKSTNRYHRFQARLNQKTRTPEACAKALKAEQELSANNRVIRVTLPDPVIKPDDVKGWNASVESVLFTKSLEARQFTIVLSASADIKKELEKLSKVKVGGGVIKVKEHDPSEVGHNAGAGKDSTEFIDPYTLYVTNLPADISKSSLEALFPGSHVTSPKKHNPKMGTPSKFAFVTYDTPPEALAALKSHFNKEIEGKSLVMRFRRLSVADLKREKEAQAKKALAKTEGEEKERVPEQQVAKAGKAAVEVKKQQEPKKQVKAAQKLAPAKGPKAVKEEEESDEEDDDDDEDDDMEEDDDDDEDGQEMEAEEDDEDDDDDDDDDDDEDDDEDDDDDDDDDDDE